MKRNSSNAEKIEDKINSWSISLGVLKVEITGLTNLKISATLRLLDGKRFLRGISSLGKKIFSTQF